ncbi:SRPBCC family protein [Peribacillus cavernae]|uniref:SRPBCC family protein n=1 Tax=Peribacillus cavernae TaxID=1674310 RepID=UPI0035206C51
MSDRVSEWFAPEAVVEPKEGGPFELYFEPGNTTGMNTKGCKITKLVDEKELQFTWKGPDQFADIMNMDNELTIVKVSFEEVDHETTKVIVEHTGFKSDENWSDAFKWHQMAWSGVLDSLKSVLEKGEGNLCCQPE